MDGRHASVRPGGDDREPVALAHGGEQERPGAGEAEEVLAAHGPAGPLALDPLGHMPLVEGPHGHETAPLRYGLRPHAAPAQAQLLEGGLYARVEDGVGLAVERESPCEASYGEATVLWHVDGHEASRPGVVQGVRALDVANRVRAGSGARVQHGLSLLHRERAHPHAHCCLLSPLSLPIIPASDHL